MKASYERLQDRLRDLKEKRDKLAEQAERARQEAARALANGKSMRIDKSITDQVELLDRAIELTRQDLADAEREHVASEVRRIEAKQAKVQSRLAAAEDTFRKAERVYQAAKRVYESEATACRAELERLESLRLPLVWKLEAERQPAQATPGKDPQVWLQEFRDGLHGSFLAGQDPNADTAFAAYQKEHEEIVQWGRQAALAGRIGGDKPKEPDCLKYYSKERVREILEKANSQGAISVPPSTSAAETPPADGTLVRRLIPIGDAVSSGGRGRQAEAPIGSGSLTRRSMTI